MALRKSGGDLTNCQFGNQSYLLRRTARQLAEAANEVVVIGHVGNRAACGIEMAGMGSSTVIRGWERNGLEQVCLL